MTARLTAAWAAATSSAQPICWVEMMCCVCNMTLSPTTQTFQKLYKTCWTLLPLWCVLILIVVCYRPTSSQAAQTLSCHQAFTAQTDVSESLMCRQQTLQPKLLPVPLLF